MRTTKDSLAARQDLIAATAVLAAHSNARGDSFRQRDVKFLLDLFNNWLEYAPGGTTTPWQNNQIARYLHLLVQEGFARQLSRTKTPRYRLTRAGLLEVVNRIVHAGELPSREHFFFLYYFVKNYRPFIESLIKDEGKSFPTAIRLELEALFDVKALVEREVAATALAVKKLVVRMREAEQASKVAKQRRAEGRSTAEIVAELEESVPYDLNSQKPLGELISELRDAQKQWELEEGNGLRVQQLWKPTLSLLQTHLKLLHELQ